MSYVWLCRHYRDISSCEQCRWEAQEQAKRFDQHVTDSLRKDAEYCRSKFDNLKTFTGVPEIPDG